MLSNIVEVIAEKRLFKRYGLLLLALFISAISYNLLIYPTKIVAGGGNGLSIVVEWAFHLSPSLFILMFNVVVLIIGVLALGIEKTSGALVASFVYPFFVDVTSGITTIISVNNSDIPLICLFAGIISGWTSGIIYKMGFSSGGTSLINQIVFEKAKISISKTSFTINLIIVLLGGLCFGINNIMYAVIVIFVSSIVIDKVLIGISKNKVFYIFTTKEKEVREFLINEVGHGITEFNVISGYLNQKGKMLMTAVPTKDYFKTSTGIKDIDKDAFFIVTDSYQLLNGA
ncbi:MAG: YitT family protein [Bacilli bacterium]|nr:YitT family protein [Bacilli bacterium]